MRMPGLVGLVVLFGCLMLAPGAHGVQLTYTLTGTITPKTDPGELISAVAVGSPVVYNVLIDTGTPNLSYTPARGSYQMASAELTIGGKSFQCEPRLIEIAANDALGPQSIFDASIWSDFWGAVGVGYFRLGDTGKQAISTAALPTSAYDLNAFETKAFSLTVGKSGVLDYSYLVGNFSSFGVLPEPATLIFGSVAGLFLLRHRHSRTPG